MEYKQHEVQCSANINKFKKKIEHENEGRKKDEKKTFQRLRLI